MVSKFGVGCGFVGILKVDKYDDIGFVFFWFEGFGMRVDEVDEMVEDGFLNEVFFVDCWGEVFEVDCGFDVFLELVDEMDIDICFEEGGVNLFEYRVEGLVIVMCDLLVVEICRKVRVGLRRRKGKGKGKDNYFFIEIWGVC